MIDNLPSELSRLRLGSGECRFWTVEAVVLDGKVWSETQIDSSRNGYGRLAAVNSSSVTRREVWVKLEGGKEKCLSIAANCPARAGNKVTLICMASDSVDRDGFYYVGLVNHTADAFAVMDVDWFLRQATGVDNPAKKALANIFVLATLGLGLIPLWLYEKSLQARFADPLLFRIRRIGEKVLAGQLGVKS